MTYKNFRFETDADGIALVTWDMAGRSMNVLNDEVVGELGQIVEKIASDEAIKGAVITSGKDGFAAGADLTMLETAGAEFSVDRGGDFGGVSVRLGAGPAVAAAEQVERDRGCRRSVLSEN